MKKKTFVILFDNDKREFVMTGPNGQETRGTVAWKLAKSAFDNGADEVVHNYDLKIQIENS